MTDAGLNEAVRQMRRARDGYAGGVHNVPALLRGALAFLAALPDEEVAVVTLARGDITNQTPGAELTLRCAAHDRVCREAWAVFAEPPPVTPGTGDC